MTEEEIITMIRAGGKAMDAGVKALYQCVAQPMLRFFVYQGVSGDDAKDVLQETIVKIIRSADSFGGTGTAKAWIWQVARNCLIDHQRKLGTMGRHEVAVNDEQWARLEETTVAPASSAISSADSVDKCVAEGLSTFSNREPERAYVLTLQMEGLSIEEIGHRIGRTVGATKEYLSQCKKKIQPFIAHCTDYLMA
ncbi:MAG: RNA polymerase sigma factor [Limnohabitans sp.]